MRATGGSVAVELEDGSPLLANAVLVATGRTPRTAELGCTIGGVALDGRGYIRTDDRLRTTAPGVFAIGDVTGRLQFTHVGDEMGRIAVANALGRLRRRRFDASAVPWVTFCDPEVARVGPIDLLPALRERAPVPVGHHRAPAHPPRPRLRTHQERRARQTVLPPRQGRPVGHRQGPQDGHLARPGHARHGLEGQARVVLVHAAGDGLVEDVQAAGGQALAVGLVDWAATSCGRAARHWQTDPAKDPDIAALVELMRTKATTDPGYLELDMWFDGPHQRTIAARQAAAHRKARPAAKGLRTPAPVELRPDRVRHAYRYQLRRPDTVVRERAPHPNEADSR